MFDAGEMANFTLMNFERGLDGLTEAEAQTRLKKADGSEMNSISWLVGHMAWHWSTVAAYARQMPQPETIKRFTVGPAADPEPPTLEGALALLSRARAESTWVAEADEGLFGTSGAEYLAMVHDLLPVETVGTALLRVILHTWFHMGEVNSIRQMLGHPEIVFVGPMNGLLEWRPAKQLVKA